MFYFFQEINDMVRMLAAAAFLSKDAQHSPEAMKLSATGIAITHQHSRAQRGREESGKKANQSGCDPNE